MPHKPSDNGNVTWTISNDPPKLSQVLSKLPQGIDYRQRAPSTITMAERRSALGAIVYSITSTHRTELGSNAKQYNIGQILSFSDSEDTGLSILPLPSSSSDIQHGLNQLDYAKLGLTNEQQAAIAVASNAIYTRLQSDVAQARSTYIGLQVLINEDQKISNETDTAIAALQVLVATSPTIAVMVTTLQATKVSAQARIAANSAAANQQTGVINDLVDQLNNLAQLVG